ncbi:Dynamin-type G domain-containing protein [[Candida] zeylanoides]
MPTSDKKTADGDAGDDATLYEQGGSTGSPRTVTYSPDSASLDATTLVSGEGSSKRHGGGAAGALGALSAAPEMDASVQQLRYNENKVALDRAINQTIALLGSVVAENRQRPVVFPTGYDEGSAASVRAQRAPEKRRIGEEAAGDPHFKILKLELKVGLSSTPLGALEKSTVATLVDAQLQSQTRYLRNLKDRVDDTTSKVFVTGDLNAGKSTFCNALLRRRVLPRDQQPCTAVFCEVVDAVRENRGVEEVHAVPRADAAAADPTSSDADVGADAAAGTAAARYNRADESTYETHSLRDLAHLVYQSDRYALLKVYVVDRRAPERSLLNNGVVDVQLIDAPGLNMDSYQTTQVFSRQEEIDLVVFVVNSENHFTLSAKEFISAAAAEKRYVFIVVNKFDNIRDKRKCQARILEQVKTLSPDSYKNSSEFVHFVSSGGGDDGSDDGGSGGDDGGSDDDDGGSDDDGLGDFSDPRFDHLEDSLRRFLLDKRSISKLLPAKSYLLNLLGDLETLSRLNCEVHARERERLTRELEAEVIPQFDAISARATQISDQIQAAVERHCSAVFHRTRSEVQHTIETFGDRQCVPYPGLQYLYEYAVATQSAMLNTVLSAVRCCEGEAKESTAATVAEVTRLGQQTLGEEFLNDKVFNPDRMFARKRSQAERGVWAQPIEVGDFFDPSLEAFVQWLGVPPEVVTSVSAQAAYFSPVAMLRGVSSSALSLKQSIPSQLTLHTVYSSTKLLTVGAVAQRAYAASHWVSHRAVRRVAVPLVVGLAGLSVFYLVSDIPNAFARKHAKKLRKQLNAADFATTNAYRVQTECRDVLSFPARQVMSNFQTSIDKRSGEKERLEREIADATASGGYFRTLLDQIAYQREYVEEIDLESVTLVD